MTWYEDVYAAIKQLGGEADYSDIYPLVRTARLARGVPLGKYKEWVRNAAQDHSGGKGRDLFEKVNRGRYRIKNRA